MHRGTLFAGPCSIESEYQIHQIITDLDKIGINWFRGGCWKPRTRPDLFEGLGEDGLKIVQNVNADFGMKFITEVATPKQLEIALKYDVDGVWIGARTTTNPFMIEELA